MDAPVLHEPFEGPTCDLTTHRVERRDGDRLWRVVHDEVHPGDRLERADVAAVAADDAPLHVVIGERHDGHRGLGNHFRGEPLDGGREDPTGAPVGLFPGLDLEIPHQDHGLAACLVLHLLEQFRLGGTGVEAGDTFEVAASLLLERREFRSAFAEVPLLVDEEFKSNGEYRSELLEEFREEIEDNGVNDPLLLDHLATRILEVYGSYETMVRFRSSSNVEDALAFNGAGLYDSTSVCALDSFDGDSDGPSRCDFNQPKERTIDRGLKHVWASLWNFRAYEEREYYQIPQDQAAMAILVTTAFPDEASNGVAFTGDPELGASAGYVINVQIGDESVVHPSVDVLPEKDVIKLTPDGAVERILRPRPSSLMEPGEHVLSDEQLIRLANIMRLVETQLYTDPEGFRPEDILLDFEFKFTQGEELILKQVRPFLRSGATVPAQTTGWTVN